MTSNFKQILFFLTVLFLLSGCTTSEGSDQTVSQGQSIEVSGPECHPVTSPNKGCSEISEFEDIVITSTVENSGDKDVKIPFKQDTSYGQDFRDLSVSMIQNTCHSLFNIEESSVDVEKVTPSGIYEYSFSGSNSDVDSGFFDTEDSGSLFGGNIKSDEIVLKPGERLEYEWNLALKEDESLLSGFECPLRFRLDTFQSVTTSKRIKFSENGQGSESFSAVSSTGPLRLVLDAPSNWEIGKEFPVTVYGENDGEGNIKNGIDLIESSPAENIDSLNCESTSSNDDFKHLRMKNDNSDSTVERTFLCQYNSRTETTSLLSLSADYQYSYDMGEINIQVCKQGDTC